MTKPKKTKQQEEREAKAKEIRDNLIADCTEDYDLMMLACENISFYTRYNIEAAKNQPYAILPLQFIYSELIKIYPLWCVCIVARRSHCMIIHHTTKFSDIMDSKEPEYIRQYNRFLLEKVRLEKENLPCVVTKVYFSDCCNAPIIEDTDFCSECKEHCEAKCYTVGVDVGENCEPKEVALQPITNPKEWDVDFYVELLKLINKYCEKGLSKPNLIHKMKYALRSCELS